MGRLQPEGPGGPSQQLLRIYVGVSETLDASPGRPRFLFLIVSECRLADLDSERNLDPTRS